MENEESVLKKINMAGIIGNTWKYFTFNYKGCDKIHI